MLGVPNIYLRGHLHFIRDVVINPVVGNVIIICDIRGLITRKSKCFTHQQN